MARMLLASYRHLDARSLLPAIQVPTLVLHRRDDTVVPVEMARYVAEHLPDSRLVELPGTDHLFFADDIDSILAEIELFLTGVPPVVPSDRVVTSLLVADVVGSTALATDMGDRRWAELLETFHGVVAREVERRGGRVIDFAGDGVLATLQGPAAAVRCAQALGEAVAPLGLRLRSGVHTGEVERLAEGGVGGVAVHLAARIMAQADGGEVLVSSTVRDLVVGSGLEFSDRGRHELKGIPGEWTLLAVQA
jgi:class 3 adenylate cyclase